MHSKLSEIVNVTVTDMDHRSNSIPYSTELKNHIFNKVRPIYVVINL